MGILDKIKNIFTDDEELEEAGTESRRIESVEIKKIPPIQDDRGEENSSSKNDPNFKFPVIFEEEDFIVKDTPKKKVEAPVESERNRMIKERLRKKDDTKKDDGTKEKFQSSPIISPIYGVLDKNYKKEDVTNRKKNTAMKEEKANKKIDVDSVRQKAYGTLVDDIEDTLFDSHDLFFAETQEKDVLPEVELLQDFDVLEDAPKREDNFSDFGVEYRKEEINIEAFLEETVNTEEEQESLFEEEVPLENDLKDELFQFIDSTYEREGKEA